MRRASDGAVIVNVRAVLSLHVPVAFEHDTALNALSCEYEDVDDLESALFDQIDTFAERVLDKEYHWEYQDPNTEAWIAFEFNGTLVNDPPVEEDDDD